MRSQKGFTLIEVMISMVILSVISMAIYQNTVSSYTLRDNIEQETDFYSGIRVALDILGRDISHMYSPQAAALPEQLAKPLAVPGADPNNPYGGGGGYAQPLAPPMGYWGEPINQSGVRPSRFQGEKEKISFVTNSHIRLYRDTPESDFAKISYYLDEDPAPARGERGAGKVLVKQEDPAIFDDAEQSETAVKFVLIDNVRSLEFSFLDGEKDTWHPTWDTTGMEHKGVFPSLIKVTLEVAMPGSESTFKLSQLYRPEMPI